jgi:hypothetical protein
MTASQLQPEPSRRKAMEGWSFVPTTVFERTTKWVFRGSKESKYCCVDLRRSLCGEAGWRRILGAVWAVLCPKSYVIAGKRTERMVAREEFKMAKARIKVWWFLLLPVYRYSCQVTAQRYATGLGFSGRTNGRIRKRKSSSLGRYRNHLNMSSL